MSNVQVWFQVYDEKKSKKRTVFFDATPYTEDVHNLEREVSKLRGGYNCKLVLPELHVSGSQVFEKTGMDEVTLPFEEATDFYGAQFGFKLPYSGQRLWMYIFGARYIAAPNLNYGDVVRINGHFYLLSDFFVLKHNDFFWPGDVASSALVAKLLPFSEEAVSNAFGCIEQLVPKRTPSEWNNTYWNNYFQEVVVANKPEVIRASEIKEAEVVTKLNFSGMKRCIAMTRAF